MSPTTGEPNNLDDNRVLKVVTRRLHPQNSIKPEGYIMSNPKDQELKNLINQIIGDVPTTNTTEEVSSQELFDVIQSVINGMGGQVVSPEEMFACGGCDECSMQDVCPKYTEMGEENFPEAAETIQAKRSTSVISGTFEIGFDAPTEADIHNTISALYEDSQIDFVVNKIQTTSEF